MPLFEYRCGSCAAVNEILVGVGAPEEAPTIRCEHCGSTDLSKLLSRINIGRSIATMRASCGQSDCAVSGASCCGGACAGH